MVMGDACGGQAPQADGALLADFGVRRKVLEGQHVERGQELRAVRGRRPTSRSKKVSTASESASACLLPSTTMTAGARRSARAARHRGPWRWW